MNRFGEDAVRTSVKVSLRASGRPDDVTRVFLVTSQCICMSLGNIWAIGSKIIEGMLVARAVGVKTRCSNILWTFDEQPSVASVHACFPAYTNIHRIRSCKMSVLYILITKIDPIESISPVLRFCFETTMLDLQ